MNKENSPFINADRDAAVPNNPKLSAELSTRISELRAQVQESFGKVVMTLMMIPRYRHQTLADLHHLVMDPMIRDRVAIAYPPQAEGAPPSQMAGLAIWASVSPDVDVRIRSQIREQVFPIRLNPEDWTSGEINWLLDVIAPDRAAATKVIANLKQIIKGGDLRLHPIIETLAEPDMMARVRARRGDALLSESHAGEGVSPRMVAHSEEAGRT